MELQHRVRFSVAQDFPVRLWSLFNTLTYFLWSRPNSSLALVLQQLSCKPRTLPYKLPTKMILAPNVMTSGHPNS